VLKVLGATRAVVLRAFLIEYALLGAVAAAIALVVGTAAAWGVVTEVMAAEWVWLPGSMAAVTLLSLAVTVGFGLVGTLAALGQKPAPYLRND
jgi:putative ABC transport system permease protein